MGLRVELAGYGIELLSQGAGNIDNEANMAYRSNQDTLNEIGQVGQGAAQIVGDLMGGFGGGGGASMENVGPGLTSQYEGASSQLTAPSNAQYSGDLFGMGGSVPTF